MGGGPASAETLTLTASAKDKDTSLPANASAFDWKHRRYGSGTSTKFLRENILRETTNDLRSLRRLLASLAVWFGELRSPHASCGFCFAADRTSFAPPASSLLPASLLASLPARRAAGSADFVRFARSAVSRHRACRHGALLPLPTSQAPAEAVALLAPPFAFARSLRSRSCSPGFARLARRWLFRFCPCSQCSHHHCSVQVACIVSRNPEAG